MTQQRGTSIRGVDTARNSSLQHAEARERTASITTLSDISQNHTVQCFEIGSDDHVGCPADKRCCLPPWNEVNCWSVRPTSTTQQLIH